MSKLPKEYKEWRPLPEGLKILESKINGQGLFSVKFIPENTELGITHIEDVYALGLVRVALGSFINHSNNPNCIIYKSSGYTHSLRTIRNIHPDEELTIDYSKASCLDKCKK